METICHRRAINKDPIATTVGSLAATDVVDCTLTYIQCQVQYSNRFDATTATLRHILYA